MIFHMFKYFLVEVFINKDIIGEVSLHRIAVLHLPRKQGPLGIQVRLLVGAFYVFENR